MRLRNRLLLVQKIISAIRFSGQKLKLLKHFSVLTDKDVGHEGGGQTEDYNQDISDG